MASMLLAEGGAPEVDGAVYLGYPLQPARRPEAQAARTAHLPEVRVPQLFVSGTRDALAPTAALTALVARLPDARLLLLPGGDHSFARRRRDEAEGPLPDWPAEVARFAHVGPARGLESAPSTADAGRSACPPPSMGAS